MALVGALAGMLLLVHKMVGAEPEDGSEREFCSGLLELAIINLNYRFDLNCRCQRTFCRQVDRNCH